MIKQSCNVLFLYPKQETNEFLLNIFFLQNTLERSFTQKVVAARLHIHFWDSFINANVFRPTKKKVYIVFIFSKFLSTFKAQQNRIYNRPSTSIHENFIDRL